MHVNVQSITVSAGLVPLVHPDVISNLKRPLSYTALWERYDAYMPSVGFDWSVAIQPLTKQVLKMS